MQTMQGDEAVLGPAPGLGRDATFDVAVQRTYRSTPTRAWDLLASPAGAEAWLGARPEPWWWPGDHGGPERGDVLETPEGDRYEVRSATAGKRIRLHALGPAHAPTTVQMTLSGERGRAIVVLRQDGLPDAAMREPMHDHWTRALDRIGDLLDERGA